MARVWRTSCSSMGARCTSRARHVATAVHDARDSNVGDGPIAGDLRRQRQGDTAPSRKGLKEGKWAQSECTVRASAL
jgi:hypothetical protein